MKRNGKLDLAIPCMVMELGKLLDECQDARRLRIVPSMDGKPVADLGDSAIERISKAVAENGGLQQLLGIQPKMDGGRRRLRIAATAWFGWHALRLGAVQGEIGEAASAIADPRLPPIEGFLLARHEIGSMIQRKVLVGGTHGCDRPSFTHAMLPGRTLTWLSGGATSLGYLTYARAARPSPSDDAPSDESSTPSAKPVPSARELYERVQPSIIGCERQLRTLCSRISLAACRAEMLARGERDVGVGNQVIVVCGGTGTGKTYLVEEIARASGLVFSSFDGAGLSGTGWAGSNVEDALKQALAIAGGDAKRASHSIVCFDEVDKVINARSAASSHRFEVQADLLRPLGGQKVTIGGKRNLDCPPTTFDCGPTTFVLSGVFDGLSDLAKRKGRRHGIGFHSSVEGEKAHADWRRAFCQCGAIEELCGRVSAFVQMDPVTADQVAHAVIFEHGIVEGYNKVLSGRGVSLLALEPAVRLIADYAVSTGGNYRAAKHLIGTVVEEILYDGERGPVLVDDALVRRAISRADGIEPEPQVVGAPCDGEADADADGVPRWS